MLGSTRRIDLMGISKEIERAVQRIAAFDTQGGKTPSEQENIVLQVRSALEQSQFDFSNTTTLVLKQSGKTRVVKQYENLYSVENILCQCSKQILDRTFKIRYPNRNRIVKELFGILAAATQMSDFTIVKFDFKDYFNSVSSIYVFEKYLKHNILDRHEIDLIREFVYATKYAYAGLCTSNAIAEIIAREFDKAIRQEFLTNGLIYYERYIDDSVLLLNEHMQKDEIEEKLKKVILDIFHDSSIDCEKKCSTKFNTQKFQYVSRRKILNNACTVDFLGYEFNFSAARKKIEIKYGITDQKRKKYNDRIDKIISYYTDSKSPDYQNLELLRHRIMAFSSREVYLTKNFRTNVWRVKGFIANYGELRYLLNTNLIEASTENFLKNMIEDAINRAGIPTPYFLMGQSKLECGYNLYGNMKSNKTLLLVDRIGYDYKSLVNLCNKIGIRNIDINGKRRGYGTLVREYLIKVKVGY